MNYFKEGKTEYRFFLLLLLLGVVLFIHPEKSLAANTKEDETYSDNGNIMVGGNWITPHAVHGQYVNIVVPIVNMGQTAVTDIIVTPVIDVSSAAFPFEIEKSNYSVELDVLEGEESGLSAFDRRREVTYSFKTREDVTNGYKSIKFKVQYVTENKERLYTELPVYVFTEGAPGAATDGEEEKGSLSTPRVIVAGFTTNPETVNAGTDFTLTLHIKNTSLRTSVSNVEFEIAAATEGKDEATSAPAFLPVSGSNTIFVNQIPAGSSTDISMDMTAKADLAQKPYVVNVSMVYEDENYKPYEASTSVSIPVKQVSRMEISEPEILPSDIEVGSQANIMFSVYNTGKTKLYNVTVRFEGDSISGGDTFLGNLESGATGNVDVMVTGEQATMDEGMIKTVISYEDETGAVTTAEKEFSLFVSEAYYGDPMINEIMPGEDMPGEGDGMQGKKPSVKVVIIVSLLAAVFIGVVLIVLLVKRKKKKKKQKELEELEKAIEEETREEKAAEETREENTDEKSAVEGKTREEKADEKKTDEKRKGSIAGEGARENFKKR